MSDSTPDTDHLLAEFIIDYAESNLSSVEQNIFDEYLASAPEINTFARKSRKGRQSLRNAFQVKAADDFEEKLARRIAEEKRSNSSMNSAGMASAC